MKKIIIFLAVLALFASYIPLASAACTLTPILVNQDPYPAIPGEIVKVLFQLDGTSDDSCGLVTFEVVEKYPFSVDPSSEKKVSVRSGTYVVNYKSYLLAPYNIRVSEDALEGDNTITVRYSKEGDQIDYIERDFDIYVEDSRTDFEVSVKQYSYETKKITLEILNTGESDVEALTVEVPNQENIEIIGNNRIIIGSIESNEEDIADFKAEINKAEFDVNVIYTDQTGVRRSIVKKVTFNEDSFKRDVVEKESNLSAGNSFFLGLIIPVIIFLIYRYHKKRKEKQRKHASLRH